MKSVEEVYARDAVDMLPNRENICNAEQMGYTYSAPEERNGSESSC